MTIGVQQAKLVFDNRFMDTQRFIKQLKRAP